MDSFRGPARLVIIGAGGHAREALDVLEAGNDAGWGPYEVLGFLDDAAEPGATLRSLPVLGGVEWLAEQPGTLAFCAIGDPATRRRVVARATAAGARFATLVHPSAVMTRHVTLGAGALVAAGCIVTNAVTIGDHAHLNLGSTVSHDGDVGEFAILAPGVHLAGNVRIGAGASIGIGAGVIQGVRIGAGTVVGAGAVVTEDLPPDVVAVGVPARVVGARSPRWDETDEG